MQQNEHSVTDAERKCDALKQQLERKQAELENAEQAFQNDIQTSHKEHQNQIDVTQNNNKNQVQSLTIELEELKKANASLKVDILWQRSKKKDTELKICELSNELNSKLNKVKTNGDILRQLVAIIRRKNEQIDQEVAQHKKIIEYYEKLICRYCLESLICTKCKN